MVYYRDMVTILRERIADRKRRGLMPDQVQVARDTRDYNGRYGATTGAWTTEMFVVAVYNTLGAVDGQALRTSSTSPLPPA